MVKHGDPLTGYVDPFPLTDAFSKFIEIATMGKPVETTPMLLCDGLVVPLDGCVSCKLEGCNKRQMDDI